MGDIRWCSCFPTLVAKTEYSSLMALCGCYRGEAVSGSLWMVVEEYLMVHLACPLLRLPLLSFLFPSSLLSTSFSPLLSFLRVPFVLHNRIPSKDMAGPKIPHLFRRASQTAYTSRSSFVRAEARGVELRARAHLKLVGIYKLNSTP